MAVKPLPGAQLDRTHPLAQGLAGLWLFNEGSGLSVYDHSGNDNHLALVNGPVWTAGEDGGAVLLDGSDDYLVHTPGAVVTGTDMSIVFRAAIPSQPLDTIMAQRDLISTSGQWELRYGYTELRGLYFWDYDGGYGFNGGVTVEFPPSTATFAFVREGTVGTFYINGVSAGTIAAVKSVVYQNRAFAIGCDYRDLTRFLATTLESTAIYSRALTADEVAWFTAEPYCMFTRPDRWLRVFDFGALTVIRPRPQYTYRMGPRMILGGVI